MSPAARPTAGSTVAGLMIRLLLSMGAVAGLIALAALGVNFYQQQEVALYRQRIVRAYDTVDAPAKVLAGAQAAFRGYLVDRSATELVCFRSSEVEFWDEVSALERVAPGVVSQNTLDAAKSDSRAWFAGATQMIALRSAGKPGWSIQQTGPMYDVANAAWKRAMDEASATREKSVADYERIGRYGLLLTGLVSGLGMAALFWMGRRANRRLSRPIRSMNEALNRYTAGHGATRIPSSDIEELSALGRTFNRFVEGNETQRRERQSAIDLQQATNRVMSHIAADGDWDEACEMMGLAVGATRAGVYVFSDDGTLSRLGVWASDAVGGLSPPMFANLVLTREEVEALTHPVFGATRGEIRDRLPQRLVEVAEAVGMQSWAVLPMHAGLALDGLIIVGHEQPNEWTLTEQAALSRWADFASRLFSERHLIDQLRALDVQKNEFLATTSHELRTPLTSISGYLEMLVDGDYGDLSRSQREAVQIIDRNLARLRALIEDLLILNGLDTAGRGGVRQELDAAVKIQRVLEIVRPMADHAGIELSAVAPQEPVHFIGERDQVERAILNVVNNAIKFTPRGGRISISVTSTDDLVTFVVADTGIGIPLADQPTIFGRFTRAANARKGQIPGTGLGLAITKAIAEVHGGGVHLESVEGEGSTVSVSFARSAGPGGTTGTSSMGTSSMGMASTGTAGTAGTAGSAASDPPRQATVSA